MKNILLLATLVIWYFGFTGFSYTDRQPVVSDCSVTVGPNLDFVLINSTGYTIENIYVAPANQREWGDDIMEKEYLEDGESVEISFAAGETIKKWDIYVTWEGYEADEDVYWLDLDLSKISEITLKYDPKTGKTWALTN